MSRRLGIDLSSEVVALADVRETRNGRIQLRGFALIDTGGDALSLAADLRRARRKHRFPRNAEVVAWAGDARVEAVRGAGLAVERVITPGEALARVERMHRASAPPGSNTAVIALHAGGGALAIVQDGRVRHETPLTWSPLTAASLGNPDLLRRYAFLSELTELLRGSFAAAAKLTGRPVTDILTCGSLPELRSFTMPLADEFDVEVETLDSADNIDVRVKGPAFDVLLDSIAAMRIAIAAGRRWHGQPAIGRKVLRVAVPSGLAAGALYAFALYGFGGGSAPSPLEEHARVTAPARPASPPRAAGPAPSRPAQPAPQQAAAPATMVAAAPPPGLAPTATREPIEPIEPVEPVRPATFTVTSILWSAERQFAVVDGQVLGVGDTVDGARIVEIQPDAVLARDRAGRLRRAPLSRPGPSSGGLE